PIETLDGHAASALGPSRDLAAATILSSSGSTYFPNGSLYGLDVSCAVTILIGALRYSNPCSATSPCRPSRGPRRMREMSSSPEHCFIIISLVLVLGRGNPRYCCEKYSDRNSDRNK